MKLVKRAGWGGGSLELMYLLSYIVLLVNMINRWGVFWQTEKGGS